MSKAILEIEFDNTSKVFLPGQIVNGNVLLTVTGSLTLKEIHLRIRGKGRLVYTDKLYFKFQMYDRKVLLLHKEANQQGDIVLQGGTYRYPFDFRLPLGVHSSYENSLQSKSYFRHSVEVTVCRSLAWNLSECAFYTVIRPLDLNRILPSVRNQGVITVEETICCCCCAVGPIEITVSTDRLGFVPGEAISLRFEIKNLSNKNAAVVIQTCLKMKFTCKHDSQCDDKKVGHQIERRNKIPPGSTDVWTDQKIHIPPLPPSSIDNKDLMLCYYLEVVPIISHMVCWPRKLEILIGNIPLQPVDQNFPNPIYKTNDGLKSTQFAPFYPYYDFGRPDPALLFQIANQ